MTQAGGIFEGTWEEIAALADSFAGKRVRLVVVDDPEGQAKDSNRPFYATATPEERARAWVRWCHLPRPSAPPLTDEAISRESAYSPDED